jgi:hypothetical protein
MLRMFSLDIKDKMEELRKHARHEVLFPAEVDIAETVFPVDVIEISIEGLRLQSKHFFTPDALVSVTIMMGRSIVFNGWVVWVLDKYLSGGHVYHTGIKIESITDAAAGILGIQQRKDLVQEIFGLARHSERQTAG